MVPATSGNGIGGASDDGPHNLSHATRVSPTTVSLVSNPKVFKRTLFCFI